MKISSSITYSIYFIFFLLVPHQSAILTEKTPPNIINKTCESCAEKGSFNFSYNFCYASLSAVSISHTADLGGPGLITLELALDNATNTLSSIISMLSRNDSETRCDTCLKSCLELYLDMCIRLEECIEEFVSGKKNDVIYMWVSEIMQEASSCEEEFKEMGDNSPLTKENHDLSRLCGMVLCIMDLMDSDLNSRSRLSSNRCLKAIR